MWSWRRFLAGLTALAAALALAPATSARAQSLDLTCQLSLTRLEATTTNVLAVDTNAVYWVTGYAAVPGARLRIEGEFPWSRFMGFNLYDAAGRPIEGLPDRGIAPRRGSTNPYRTGARRHAKRRGYRVFVEFGPKPADPAPNTLYAGDSLGGTLWYRVYIPDSGRDEMGGVALPRVTVEPAGGGRALPGIDACRSLQLPFLQQVNDAIAAAPAVPPLSGTAYPGRNPPNWRLFVNLGRGAADILLDNEIGEQFHAAALEAQNDGPGFFSSSSIAYVFAPTSRGFGDVLLLRGRAPGFADTRAGPRRMPPAQTRYWSICQYEPATQRVIACRPDDRIAVDRRGRFRVVISTAADRPRNARRRCGYSWLPWGPKTQGLVIYRQMLARRAFERAIARIPRPGAEREVMRGYYPRGRYLADTGTFESRGCRR